MDKGQAIHDFWSKFGLPAYEQTTIDKEASMPYVTYEVTTGSFDGTVSLAGDLWYYSESWETITKKADEIARFIGIGGVIRKIDGGYMWIKLGVPFAQHVADTNDMVRRIRMNIQVDFLTET